MATEKVRTEELHINGEDLLAKVKELIHEGTVRRIILKNEEGRTLVEIPLLVGLIGAAMMPVLAAVGAIAALAAKLTLVVEKTDDVVDDKRVEIPVQ
jgi:Flp pilus assembly pilin Flp